MKNKILGILSICLISGISFSSIKAYDYSKDYIDLVNNYTESSKDVNWYGKNPTISGYKYFYTVDENIPSYIEYKISCKDKKDCGFVVVNSNGEDVYVPIAGTDGKTPSEVLTNKGEEKNTKIYYFGGFEQFSENQKTGEVKAINPRYDKESEEIAKSYKTFVDKEEVKTSLLKSKLSQYKEGAKKIVPENRSMRMSRAYTPPSTPADTFLNEAITTRDGCSGSIPCYDQFGMGFLWLCNSGCSPTALAMVFGYYDRNGYDRLIEGIAPRVNNSKIVNIVNKIRNDLGTDCGGGTHTLDIERGIKYARDNGYPNSTIDYVATLPYLVAKKVKYEVDRGRPLLVADEGHNMVAYGYSSKNNNIVRLNLGWGPTSKENGYKTSSIDYDVTSNLYYNGEEQSGLNEYWEIILKK